MNIFTEFPISFHADALGMTFAALTAIIFLCAGIYSFEYMEKEGHKSRYALFYILAMGAELGLCFAGNIVTFYMFFELLTLSSMPLVLHEGTHESVLAALKYMLFSLFGAYMALFGIYFIVKYGATYDFVPGGVIPAAAWGEHHTLLLVVSMCMVLGFGVKAGMFPMHSWLPTAHPVAPAPASAVLSAVIVKAGILGMIRSVYYCLGAVNIRGSVVQKVWMILALITVFMGSMLAYREKILKKRLAYSTVSQLSYISFGLALMNEDAFSGAVLHVFSHGFVKAVLFMTAGAIIHYTGAVNVDDMRGVGKKMPIAMWCYTICSLGLIGIPPTGGFISKWYLAIGSLKSGISVFNVLGPIILLVSALLTAGYLLPLTINGFLPGEDYKMRKRDKAEPGLKMLVPMIILTLLSVLMGLLPDGIVDSVHSYFSQLM